MSVTAPPGTGGQADSETGVAGVLTAPFMPFSGRSSLSLDAKGRLVVPVANRHAYAQGGYLVLWRGPCIALLPLSEFKRWVSYVRRSANADALAATDVPEAPEEILRAAHIDSVPVRLDSQGRIGVPETMRSTVGIGRDVVVVGNEHRLELWMPGSESPDIEAHRESIGLYQVAYDLTPRDE